MDKNNVFEHRCTHCGLPFESDCEIDDMCFDCVEEMEGDEVKQNDN